MILISVSDLPTLVSAIPLIRLLSLTVNDFLEGRGGVNTLLLCEEWLISDESWLKWALKWLSRVRTCSKTGDQRERLQEMLTSTFLKRGTLIVPFSKYVSYCQWMFLSLARDADNAVSEKAGGCQGLFLQYNGKRRLMW